MHEDSRRAFQAARGLVAIVARERFEVVQPPLPRGLPEDAPRPFGNRRAPEWRSKPEERGVVPVIHCVTIEYSDFMEALPERPGATLTYYQRA